MTTVTQRMTVTGTNSSEPMNSDAVKSLDFSDVISTSSDVTTRRVVTGDVT